MSAQNVGTKPRWITGDRKIQWCVQDSLNLYLVKEHYPGIVVSPINSECELSDILSQPGHLYIAMEELYPSSGFYPVVEQHEMTVVTSTYSEDNCAVSQLGAVEVPDMTAKIIVVGNYVYVGSVNLDYNSIHCNRELGIIIWAIQGSFANCNISVDLDLFNEGIIEYI